jgi:hypothetical protein
MNETDKAKLLNPDALTSWLRKQDPDKGYVWSDPVFCLMGSYLADNGALWGEFAYSEMPNYHEIAQAKPWTFGAALERAEAIKALPPPALQLAPPTALSKEPELVTVDAE